MVAKEAADSVLAVVMVQSTKVPELRIGGITTVIFFIVAPVSLNCQVKRSQITKK